MKRKRWLIAGPMQVGLSMTIGGLLLSSTVFAQSPEAAPLNPAFVEYLAQAKQAQSQQAQPNRKQVQTQGQQLQTEPQQARITARQAQTMAAGEHGLGRVPFPVDLSHLQQQATQRAARSSSTFAATYDLRTLGRVTPVRDQNPYGTCWAFGTYGSLESCLLPSENTDFSENNLANLAGFDWGFYNGGNAFISMAYLARWSGPVNEADDPYPNPGGSLAGLTVRKHVQQVRLIPNKTTPTGNDEIKQVLMDCGAVDVSFYWTNSSFNSTYNTYLYTGTASSNHDVTLVGWDDNFDRNKFATVPAGDGAYIVKNSWGSGWGDAGYFYVSYYDTVFTHDGMFCFLNTEQTTSSATQYSYDPFGWVSSLGGSLAVSNALWGANIFTARETDSLCAVGFYANSVNTSYEIYVYNGVTAGAPTSGTLAATQTGTCSYPGYRTISLDTPAALTNGQQFSIVLKLTTPGYIYPQPFEYAISGYDSQATASPGQSFYQSPGGTTWTDLTTIFPTGNFCIKGFTSPVDPNAPTSFSAVPASSSRIDLSWNKDPSGNDVIVAWNTNDVFGSPSGAYSVGDPISGGGTVLYVGGAAGAPHTGLTAGTRYFYKAWSVLGSGVYSRSASCSAITPIPPPANDLFANAALMSGPADEVWGANIGATKESGEPNHASNAGGHSVWWKWVAPVTGTVAVDTIGSNFDTLLGVYTGSSVSSLTTIASDDQSGDGNTSALSFSATAGTTYWIAVDGSNGATGNVTLTLNYAPSDMFADATSITGSAAHLGGTNVGATKESGEPAHAGSTGGHSVWWKWVAPEAGSVAVDTVGSSFDTQLGVYTGSSVDALTTIASDDDGGGNFTSAVVFASVAGTTYWIAVDGWGGTTGAVRLNLSFVPTGLTDGLAAYWAFSYANILGDSSGNGHNINTVTGTVYTVPSMIGRAVNFVGTGSLSASSFTVTPANLRSICLWVNQPTVLRKTQDIISKHSNPADVEYLIQSAADGKYDFEWTIGGNLYDGSRGGSGGDDGIGLVEPTPGQWDFLVLTYDGSTIRFYDNGSLVRSIAATGDIATSTYPLTIGAFAFDHTNSFTGTVDEVRIYNRALSASDVTTLYLAGIQAVTPSFATQPSNQTVSAGDTASFTAVASGTPTPAYKWQVSTNGGSVWADVPASSPYSGQETGTLTITGATMSLNGYKYHCLATNCAGSTPSDAATLSVSKAVPVITWPAPAPITYPTALSSKQLNATASVPGSFVYVPAAGTVLSGGAHTLHATFTPTSTANYTNATATQTLMVNKAVPVITWPVPAAITYGTALSAAQLNATASVPGTMVYSPAAGTVVGAGAHTLHMTFTPTDTADYATVAPTQVLTVNKAVPVITWAAPAPIPYGTPLSATQLNATANVPGVFTYSQALGAVLRGGGHTVHAFFTPTDTTDYTSTSTTQVVTISKLVPVITWPAPAPITYGTPLSATQLNATASVPGVLAYAPAAGTVLKGGTQTLKVYFTATDSTDYAGTTATTTLTVNKAVPVITWAVPVPITYGTALSATQLNARASVTGTFVYVPAAGAMLSRGAHTLHVTFTPNNTTNYATATGTQIVTVNKAVPVITWPAPASITYGTALSATQLNATASVPGSFAYSPAAGTVLKVGTQTLRVTFTPTDTTNYAVATATQTLTVTSASGQAFLQKLFKLVYGRPIDSTTLSNYLAAMAGGLTRAQVYGEMINSPEYGARQIDPVIRLHYAALGRIPDYATLQKWSGALQAGNLTLTGLADQLSSSAEFVQRYGSLDNTQFVQQLSHDLRGCEADTAGLAGRVAKLDSGVSRGAMLLSLAESDEFKTDVSDQLEIARLYCLLQQRMPTATELLVWQDLLLGDGQTDDAALTDQFRATFLDDPGFAN